MFDFFDISHTSDVEVVIFWNYEIEIDIGRIGDSDDRIAQRIFFKNKKQYQYDCMDAVEYPKCFYEIWTKKVYLKWNGATLAAGLSNLDVLTKRYAVQCIEINGKGYVLSIYSQWRFLNVSIGVNGNLSGKYI